MIDDLLLHIHAAETIQAGISDGDIKHPFQVILRKAEHLLVPQLQEYIVDNIFGKETGNELLRKASTSGHTPYKYAGIDLCPKMHSPYLQI